MPYSCSICANLLQMSDRLKIGFHEEGFNLEPSCRLHLFTMGKSGPQVIVDHGFERTAGPPRLGMQALGNILIDCQSGSHASGRCHKSIMIPIC